MSRLRMALVVGTLWLVQFTAACQFLIVSPILSRIGEALKVDTSVLGLLISGYGVMVAASAILAGPVSDRFGRRLVILGGCGLMGSALVLHAFAESFAALLSLRMLAGAASGMLAGSLVAFVGDTLPYEHRGRAIGVLISAMSLGQVVGIPAGTVLAERWGFQAPFVSFGVLMLAAFFTALVSLPTPQVNRLDRLDLATARAAYASILARRDVQAIAVASATMMLSVSLYMVYMPKWLEDRFEADGSAVAFVFLVGGLGSAIAGPIAGWASDRLGRIRMIVLGSVLVAVTMFATPAIPGLGWAPWAFLAVMLAASLRMSPINALQTAMVPATQRGTLISLTMATGQLGFALGSGLSGPIYARHGFGAAAAAAGILGLFAALITWREVPEPENESRM